MGCARVWVRVCARAGSGTCMASPELMCMCVAGGVNEARRGPVPPPSVFVVTFYLLVLSGVIITYEYQGRSRVLTKTSGGLAWGSFQGPDMNL